jgi:predicted alpha/beta-fold hydrolase
MPDGGTISVDWASPSLDKMETNPETGDIVSLDVKKALVVIFPGLTGGSDKGYIKTLTRYLRDQGDFSVAVINTRGISKTELTSPKLININDNSEILIPMSAIQAKLKGDTKIFALGLSMGGNIAVRV